MHPPPLIALASVAAFLVIHVTAADEGGAPSDPLAQFSARARAELRRGAAVVELPRERDDDISVFGAVRTSAAPETLLAWSRRITEQQRGKYVPQIGRFSSPPQLENLASLVLDDEDLEDLRDCRPRHCHLKLAASEMQQMSAALAASGQRWREVALRTFRDIMLARARAFERHGFHSVLPYDDEDEPVNPAAEFRTVLGRFAQDPLLTPRVAQYLQSYPRSADGAESFLFWSKEQLGDAKPVVSITHLAILRGNSGDPITVAASQVFATHYLNASLSLTAMASAAEDGGRYLLYVRRSRADVFDGAFGGIIRRLVSRRVRNEGPTLLDGFRQRLEAGLLIPNH